MKMLKSKILAGLVLAASCLSAHASYIVGGATNSLISDSGGWAWDGAYMAGFRGALENTSNFGPAGIVNRTISTTNLNAVNSGTLAGVNMFVGTWVSDAQGAGFSAAMMSFFLGGGDLFLLQDDSSHDILGTTLGISTTASDGSDSNGSAPLFSGPFGNASNVKQFYNVGQLDETAVLAKHGHVGGRNASNQVTSAYWHAGEYAAGAGSLFIIADIDMIATTSACGSPVCGASYAPLNDNGIYALNTFSFLQANSGSKVPEPGSIALFGGALVLLALRRRAM
ncbi:PEP-CTERM sorting domain-containing protein [Undibacterium parvum]|uniref:PEP-CTERM sorting domain-containing protein n=2 Tax=Undibacterium parvum TaxID=401471 RepID=A0A3Q9BRQ5_9BURK|nr:PEP-CTERM sorting domain-containing protein [Undibacterium parvum]